MLTRRKGIANIFVHKRYRTKLTNKVRQRVAGLLVVAEQCRPVRGVEDELEVLEGLSVRDVLVDIVEAVGDLRGVGAHHAVRVEPAPAGVLSLAVHQVVEGLVGSAHGVLLCVHCVVQQLAVEQRQRHHVRALWHDGVNRVQRGHGVGVEVVGLGHVVEPRVAVADVVADEGQPHQGRLVELLVATHGVHQFHRGSNARAVDADVLEVVVVAAVALAKLGVNRHNFVLDARYGVHVRAVFGLHMAGAPGAHRLVQLVLGVLQELVKVPAVGGEPLRRNVKVRGGGVAQHNQAALLGVLAE